VTRFSEIGSIYVRIAHTYVRRAPSLVLLATFVFVPLGLVEALTVRAEVGSLSLGRGLEFAAAIAAALALALTTLLGEVFYSGAVAISLTHSEHGRPPSLRQIASRLNYGRLIAVDLIYGLLVTVGLVLLIAPGVIFFTIFGLSGPVVEIENRGPRAAFSRSLGLVRGRFWTVLAVLGPIEIVGDSLTDLLTRSVHHLLGGSIVAEWCAESLSNIVLAPVYAIAAVLLTIDLIAEADGGVFKLNSAPAHP
jgi:hypothetical protein